LMGEDERPTAVQDLVKLAYCLKKDHGLKQIPKAILRTIDKVAKKIREGLANATKVARDARVVAGRRFASFAGNAPPRAPSVNEKAPSGAFKAGHLGYVPRRV